MEIQRQSVSGLSIPSKTVIFLTKQNCSFWNRHRGKKIMKKWTWSARFFSEHFYKSNGHLFLVCSQCMCHKLSLPSVNTPWFILSRLCQVISFLSTMKLLLPTSGTQDISRSVLSMFSHLSFAFHFQKTAKSAVNTESKIIQISPQSRHLDSISSCSMSKMESWVFLIIS